MAFTPCTAALAANIATACSAPRIKGYEQIGIIINKNDIDMSNMALSVDGHTFGSLTLKSGKKFGVIYNSKKNPLPFGGTQTAYNRDANQYDKTVQFYYEGVGYDSALKVVEPLKDGDYVVILERKNKTGGTFQVFGLQKGLSCGNDGGAQVQDEENGYWLMTMTTQEPFAEIEYLDGTIEETKVFFDGFIAGSM